MTPNVPPRTTQSLPNIMSEPAAKIIQLPRSAARHSCPGPLIPGVFSRCVENASDQLLGSGEASYVYLPPLSLNEFNRSSHQNIIGEPLEPSPFKRVNQLVCSPSLEILHTLPNSDHDLSNDTLALEQEQAPQTEFNNLKITQEQQTQQNLASEHAHDKSTLLCEGYKEVPMPHDITKEIRLNDKDLHSINHYSQENSHRGSTLKVVPFRVTQGGPQGGPIAGPIGGSLGDLRKAQELPVTPNVISSPSNEATPNITETHVDYATQIKEQQVLDMVMSPTSDSISINNDEAIIRELEVDSNCDEKFKNRSWLRQNRSHQKQLQASGFRVLNFGVKKKVCSICHMCFSKEMFVWRHASRHIACKPFHCAVCNQRFTRSDTLQRHVRRTGHNLE